MRNLAVYVSANARTTNTIVKSRKNTADGNLTITIGPGATGFFEDTTNADTLAATDDYATATLTGTGTETLTCQSISLDFVSSGGQGLTINGRGVGFTIPAASTNYFPIGGALNAGTTEAGAQQKPRHRVRFTGLKVHVQSNTITAASVLRLRKNGANANMICNIPASTNNYITDTTNTDTFETTDDISIQLVAGATGTSLSLRLITVNPFDLAVAKTISETDTIGESRARNKAAWRLQP